MRTELPLNWRTLTVAELRRWLRETSNVPSYMLYARKDRLVRHIEENVDVPRCPTCGRRT